MKELNVEDIKLDITNKEQNINNREQEDFTVSDIENKDNIDKSNEFIDVNDTGLSDNIKKENLRETLIYIVFNIVGLMLVPNLFLAGIVIGIKYWIGLFYLGIIIESVIMNAVPLFINRIVEKRFNLKKYMLFILLTTGLHIVLFAGFIFFL